MTKLSGILGGFDRLVRMIPNAPSIVGAGLIQLPSLRACQWRTVKR